MKDWEKKREVSRKEKKKMLVLSNAIHISQYLKWCLENHTHEYYTWVKAIPASYRKHRVWLRAIDTDVTACKLQTKEKNPKKIIFLKKPPACLLLHVYKRF